MRTPVIAAITSTSKESIKGVNAAIKSFEPQTRKMIQSIWIMAGNDGYKFAVQNFGNHQQKVAAWLSYVAGYMNTQAGAKIKGITAETQDLIQHALFAGMEQEESIPELTDRVQGVFDGMEDWRATRIARSETVDAYNQATLQQGRDAGSTLDIMWIATDDDRTRPAHAAMDGETIPHDQTEGFDCEDGTNWPGEAVNCRCCIGHAVPEAGETPAEGTEEPAAQEGGNVMDGWPQAQGSNDFIDNYPELNDTVENLGIATHSDMGNDLSVANTFAQEIGDALDDGRLTAKPMLLDSYEMPENVLMRIDANYKYYGEPVGTRISYNSILSHDDWERLFGENHSLIVNNLPPGNSMAYAKDADGAIKMATDHEIGHQIIADQGMNHYTDWFDYYHSALGKEALGRMSLYTGKNEEEAWAETYTMYVNGQQRYIPNTALNMFNKWAKMDGYLKGLT
jgi:SPP1 gp7 family putative phage head morphogenesis protein